jgi:DNA-binding response OmpR family regulator
MTENIEHDAGPERAMRILVVNPHAGSELSRLLARDGHDVLELADEDRPRRLLGVFAPEVILILGPEPATICRELRRAAPNVAILALVLGREVEDRVAMLDAGADDCLAVPFHHEELKARVRAIRRHRGPAGPAERASTRDRVSHR